MKQPNKIVLFFPWCIHFTRGKSRVLLVPDLRCTVNLISRRRRCGQLISAAINSKRQQKAWFIFHSWKIQSHLFVSGLDICRAGIPVTLRLALAARTTATSCRACFYQHAWIVTHIVLAACVAHCISELYLQLSFNNHTHTHTHAPSVYISYIPVISDAPLHLQIKNDLPQPSHSDKPSSLNIKYKMYFVWRHSLSLSITGENLCLCFPSAWMPPKHSTQHTWQ